MARSFSVRVRKKVGDAKKFVCSENGTAVNAQNQWIWTEEGPLVCTRIELQVTAKQLPVMSLVAIMGGTLACIALHIYYAVAYILCQVYNRLALRQR